jgi:hypothetical protein
MLGVKWEQQIENVKEWEEEISGIEIRSYLYLIYIVAFNCQVSCHIVSLANHGHPLPAEIFSYPSDPVLTTSERKAWDESGGRLGLLVFK